MHNTLIAVGPDFHRGTNDLPTGNVDLAPTILQILDIKPPQQLDGRVLIEAIATTGKQKPEIKTIEATREFPSGTWRQHLQTSQIGSTIYFDEGNGGFSAKK
jgi:arylsulfatase A-like enzyme